MVMFISGFDLWYTLSSVIFYLLDQYLSIKGDPVILNHFTMSFKSSWLKETFNLLQLKNLFNINF